MTVKRKVDLQSLILKLFDEKEVLSIHEITRSAGMSTCSPANRRAIQRGAKLSTCTISTMERILPVPLPVIVRISFRPLFWACIKKRIAYICAPVHILGETSSGF